MDRTPTLNDAVQLFQAGFTQDFCAMASPQRWVGLENEYLLVDATGQMCSRSIVDELWLALHKLGWQLLKDDVSEQVIGVQWRRSELEGVKHHHFDVITTDLGYAVLEIDLAPTPSLVLAHQRLRQLIETVTSILTTLGGVLLAYGVQPSTGPDPTHLARKSRYKLMLDLCRQESVLNTLGYGVDLHTLDAACQTHVEVARDETIPVVNALNATSGLRVALLANSPVWQNDLAGYKAVRLQFVDWCWPGRKQQLGIPPRFQNIEHYVDYIFDFRPLMVKRQQKLYQISNHGTFLRFFTAAQGQPGVSLDGQTRHLYGCVEDVLSQAGLAWFSARLQPAYGTVEDRVCCQQPPSQHLCGTALTLGLVENYPALLEFSTRLSLDQWRDIHQLAILYGADFSYPGVTIRELLTSLVSIAALGLKRRALGEEYYLEPLYDRIEMRYCPADNVLACFSAGGVTRIVAENDMRLFLSSVPPESCHLENGQKL